jgi:hypothetical protein
MSEQLDRAGDEAVDQARDVLCFPLHDLAHGRFQPIGGLPWCVASRTSVAISLTMQHSAQATSGIPLTRASAMFARNDIVDLADVADGVLSARSFQAHRTAGRDQAVHPVAPSDLAVFAGFGRGAVTVR